MESEIIWNEKTNRKHMFTEDGQSIRTITFSLQTTSISNSTLKKFFQTFGSLEYFRPRTKHIYTHGFAKYIDPYAAGALLQCKTHYLAGFEIKVLPSYTWHQEKDQNRKFHQTLNPNKEAIKFLDLNDDCIIHLFRMLDWIDLCNVKKTCVKFEQIADYIFPRKYARLSIVHTTHTLYQLWDLFESFGNRILEFHISAQTLISECRFRLLQFVLKYCTSLRSLHLTGFKFNNTLYGIKSEMFNHLEELSLKLCDFTGDSQNFFARCRNIRKLTIQGVRVPNSCLNTHFTHLEVLQLSTLEDISVGIIQKISNWTNIKTIWINSKSQQNEILDMSSLSALKLEQLAINSKIQPDIIQSFAHTIQMLNLTMPDNIDDILTPIFNCKGLRSLKLNGMQNINDRQLEELANQLPHLSDSHIINCESVSKTGILSFTKIAQNCNKITLAKSGIEIDDNLFKQLVSVVVKAKRDCITIYLYKTLTNVNTTSHNGKFVKLINMNL